jgi:hypothetical protein
MLALRSSSNGSRRLLGREHEGGIDGNHEMWGGVTLSSEFRIVPTQIAMATVTYLLQLPTCWTVREEQVPC